MRAHSDNSILFDNPQQHQPIDLSGYRLISESRRRGAVDSDSLQVKLRDPESVLSTQRGQQVLHFIAKSSQGVTLREIQDGTDLTYYKAYSCVSRLEEEGWVTHTEGESHGGAKGTYTYQCPETIKNALVDELGCMVVLDMDVAALPNQEPEPYSLQEEQENPLVEVLRGIRSPARITYLRILEKIADLNEVSMGQLSRELNLKTQNVHSKLMKLLELEILKRNRVKNQFYYSFESEISVHHIDALMKIEGITSVEQLEGGSEVPNMARSSNQEVQKSTPDSDRKVLENLTGKLPDFDPSWPTEVQLRWMSSFESLIQMSKANKSNEV